MSLRNPYAPPAPHTDEREGAATFSSNIHGRRALWLSIALMFIVYASHTLIALFLPQRLATPHLLIFAKYSFGTLFAIACISNIVAFLYGSTRVRNVAAALGIIYLALLARLFAV